MQVQEIMHKGVNTVQIGDSIKKVAALMKREDIGAVPVYKNERPVGFVTDRDIVVSCLAQGHSSDEPISLAMRGDVICVKDKDDVNQAAHIMQSKQISRLLVVNESEEAVGMLTIGDLLRLPDDRLKVEIISEIKRQ